MIFITEILLLTNKLLLAYFLFSGMYLLVYAVSSFFRKRELNTEVAGLKRDLAIIIPAYKEDSVICSSAIAAKQHQSYLSNLRVLVVADSLKEKTIAKLRNEKVDIIEVTFKNSTKAKSINAALAYLPDTTDYVIILDADNVMQPGAVDELIRKASSGYSVVQGHRVAKNMNSRFAILDAVSEEVNNTIFRQGHVRLGLSAALIGSGFLADYLLFKQMMQSIEAVGGFDKELELLLFKHGKKIAYADQAVIYDEKVQHADSFYHQRRRWVSAQLVYLKRNWYEAFLALTKDGNFDYFDKVLQFALPPRILSIGVPFIMLSLSFLAMKFDFMEKSIVTWWVMAFVSGTIPVILAVPRKLWSADVFRALVAIPAGFIMMLKAFVMVRGANKKFIHTPHESLNININDHIQ